MNDKTKHVIVGAAFGLASLFIAFRYGLAIAYAATTIVATIVFIEKEKLDEVKPKPTGFDRMDLVADYAGLAIGFILSFLIYNIVKLCEIL